MSVWIMEDEYGRERKFGAVHVKGVAKTRSSPEEAKRGGTQAGPLIIIKKTAITKKPTCCKVQTVKASRRLLLLAIIINGFAFSSLHFYINK